MGSGHRVGLNLRVPPWEEERHTILSASFKVLACIFIAGMQLEDGVQRQPRRNCFLGY